MKRLFFALICTLPILLSGPAVAKRETIDSVLNKANQYYNDGNFNLALYHSFRYLYTQKKISKKFNKILEKIISKTGTLPLYLYDISFLKRFSSVPSIRLHIAHILFKRNMYDESLKYASVPKDNSLHPEALLLKGSILLLKKDASHIKYHKRCMKSAKKFESFIYHRRFKRYFILIRENCRMNLARWHYQNKDYKRSIKEYNEIDKRSYSWPYLLLEKAWAYYKLGDYNRSLGILMTYESPLLSSYFLPEAEVLKTLSYFRLCMYKDVVHQMNKYYRIHADQSNKLKKLMKSEKGKYFYFNILTGKIDRKKNPFLHKLRNQLKKKLRVNLHYLSYQKAIAELKKLRASKNKSSKDIRFLKKSIAKMKKVINSHVKEYYYFFINKIHFYSYEMFNVKLEVISKKKDLVYSNKKLISNRARGSYENVQRDSKEFFFSFNGAFWADELGDYSFGLKSNCKKVSVDEK